MAPSSDRAARTAMAAVVPAAGRAVRYGGDKLLATLDGAPLIDRTLASLVDAGASRIAVVVDAARPLPDTAGLRGRCVVVVQNVDAGRGMWSSIQAGLAAVDAGTILVLPGDMPFVRPATVRAVAERAREGHAVVPVHVGKRGHPIAMSGALRKRLLEADDRSTLKQVLRDLAVAVDELPVDDPGVLSDVDVAADLVDGSRRHPR